MMNWSLDWPQIINAILLFVVVVVVVIRKPLPSFRHDIYNMRRLLFISIGWTDRRWPGVNAHPVWSDSPLRWIRHQWNQWDSPFIFDVCLKKRRFIAMGLV